MLRDPSRYMTKWRKGNPPTQPMNHISGSGSVEPDGFVPQSLSGSDDARRKAWTFHPPKFNSLRTRLAGSRGCIVGHCTLSTHAPSTVSIPQYRLIVSSQGNRGQGNRGRLPAYKSMLALYIFYYHKLFNYQILKPHGLGKVSYIFSTYLLHHQRASGLCLPLLRYTTSAGQRSLKLYDAFGFA